MANFSLPVGRVLHNRKDVTDGVDESVVNTPAGDVVLERRVTAARGAIGDVAAGSGGVVIANAGDDTVSVLDPASLRMSGAIAVDGRGRTNGANIYAIGDVTGKLMLAHTAEAMGVGAAETIGGAETMEINFDMIPRATFCQPQIASFGYSEAQAKELGYDVKVASFPFSANGKARGMAEGVGFVKIVADAEHNEIVGAHMIGPEVTELLPALTLAQQWDLTADEVARNVFAHPTLSEAMKEAVEGIAGHMINL